MEKYLKIFLFNFFHSISNERFIGSTIREAKEFFIRSFSEGGKKPQGKESECPYTWVSKPCWSVSLYWRRLKLPALGCHPAKGRCMGSNTMGGVSMKAPEVGSMGSQTQRRKICSFNSFQNTFQLKENQNHNNLILLSHSKLILFIMANVRTSVSPLNYLSETIPLDLTPMFKWFLK